MGAVQTVFWTAHRELRETSDLTIEDANMHHSKIVCDVVSGIQKSLHQQQVHKETPTVMQEPLDRVTNKVHNTQQQLATKL